MVNFIKFFMNKTFQLDSLTEDILNLLAASNLPQAEKEMWVNLLPDMIESEKKDLKELLEKEIDYEFTTAEKEAKKFLQVLSNDSATL